jgi:hypothetical protein
VVFLLLAPTVCAQGPAEVQLSNPRFKQQQVVNFNPRFSVSRSGSDDVDFLPGQMRTPPANMRDKAIYSAQWLSKAEATAYNSGSKTIKAIVWEYVFFADAAMNQELSRYQIITKKKLRPGETRVLKGVVWSPSRSTYQQASLRRIEYADGSVWQAP